MTKYLYTAQVVFPVPDRPSRMEGAGGDGLAVMTFHSAGDSLKGSSTWDKGTDSRIGKSGSGVTVSSVSMWHGVQNGTVSRVHAMLQVNT